MSKLFLVVVGCVLLLQGCNSSEPKRELPKQPTHVMSFNEATLLDITPLADGGAYASEIGGGLWYLRAGEAIRVKEVDQLSTKPTSLLSTDRERALWTLLQRERSTRRHADSHRDSYSDNSDQNEFR